MPPFDFDQCAKDLAAGVSRRDTLRRLGLGLVSGVLAMFSTGPRAAAAGREPPPQPECARCIGDFIGPCVSSCVRTFDPETCSLACYEGSLATCTVLGECQ